MTITTRHIALSLLLCALACMLGACTGHTLRGVVIHGQASSVEIVPAKSAQWNNALLGDPIPGAQLVLQLDPSRPDRRVAGTGSSRGDGAFEIRIKEPGAGLLMFDAALSARAAGRTPAQSFFTLPSGNARVIITLSPGRDFNIGGAGYDIEHEAERFMR